MEYSRIYEADTADVLNVVMSEANYNKVLLNCGGVV